MTDDFIRYGTLGGAYAGIPDKIAALFKEGNIKEKIDRPLILNYLNGREEKWPKALDYISYYIELFRQWAYRHTDGDKILLQEIDNYIKDLYEWLKQGREKGQLDDIEGRRLQLLKESLTEKLNEYVPERLILGGQESIDKLLCDIENSERATTYPSKPSDTWYNAEIERLCLLSEKIKLLRKLVEKIHPEDANKYHYLHYLFEIMGDISSYIGVLERSRDELYASIGKVKIDIEQHFSKLDESIDNTNRDIKRHLSELKENLVASKPLEIKEIIRALRQYRNSKDISVLPPIRQLYNTLYKNKRQYAEKTIDAIVQLGRAVRSDAGYHQYNLLEELSDDAVLSDVESWNTNNNQQLSDLASLDKVKKIAEAKIETGQKIMPKEYIELAEKIAANLEDWANPKDGSGIRSEYTGCLKPIDTALKGIDELLGWLHLNRADAGEFLQANYDGLVSNVNLDNHLAETFYEGDMVFSKEDAEDFAFTLRFIANMDEGGLIKKPNVIPLEIRVARVIREHPNMKSGDVAKLAGVSGENADGIVRGTKAWKNRKQLRDTSKVHGGYKSMGDVSGGFSGTGKRSDVVPVFNEPLAEHNDINEMIKEFQLGKVKTYPTPEDISKKLSTPDDPVSTKRAKELLKETKNIFGYDD